MPIPDCMWFTQTVSILLELCEVTEILIDWLIDISTIFMLCTGILCVCACVQCYVCTQCCGDVYACVPVCACTLEWEIRSCCSEHDHEWLWSLSPEQLIHTVDMKTWSIVMHIICLRGSYFRKRCRGGAFSIVTCVNTIRCEFGISFWNLCECYRMANQNPIIECCSCFYTHPIMCDVQN